MAINSANKASIAFKNLLNASNTDATNKELSNEAEGIFFNVSSNTIFTEAINSTPATAVAAGVAIYVSADLTLDSTSNGHAYFATWPNPLPSGTPAGIVSGQRIKNAIPPAYGTAYAAIPIDNTARTIPGGDPKDWIYQYQSGVYYQDKVDVSNTGTPTKMNLYVYKGKTLDTSLATLSAGSVSESYSNLNMNASVTVADDNIACANAIVDIPTSQIEVFINGIKENVGIGMACVFRAPASPFTARVPGTEHQGDILHWYGSIAGYQLDATDDVDFKYFK